MASATPQSFHRTPLQRLVLHAPNPVVRAVLRSPLHGMLSGGLLLLTYTGRRSGTVYTIPVGYRREGDALLVTVGWPEHKLWWRNLREPGAVVTARVRGEDIRMRAEVREDADGVTVALTPAA